MTKPSKVLIIGSGPIVIGQACCHSEGAERLKNLRKTRPFATLRVTVRGLRVTEAAQGDSKGAQGDNRMTRVTDCNGLQYMSGVSRTERWLNTMSIS